MNRSSPAAPSPPALRPLTEDDPPSVGGRALLGRIGSGGMGVVFLARGHDDELLAVKVVSPSYAHDPDFRARFAREVALAQRVKATCTPAIRAVGLNDTRPWMAMEYVPGPTLSEYVRGAAPLSGARLLCFGLGVAEALVAIHRAGVVHRDLKPGNVVLGPKGPCVLDFGIARARDAASVTRTGAVYGTPGYVSPERMDGVETPAADVFSWGAVIAFAATGRPPFGSGNHQARSRRAVRGEADLDGLTPPLLPLVRVALDPDHRLRPSAREVFGGLVGELDADTATVGAGEDAYELTDRLLGNSWKPVRDTRRSSARKRPRGGYGDRRGGGRPTPRRGPRNADAARAGAVPAEPDVEFAGQTFTDPSRLAYTLAGNHRAAEEWLREGGVDALLAWGPLRDHPRLPGPHLRAARSGGSRAQRAVTVLAAVLRPQDPPLYRGVAIDTAGLVRLALTGERGAERPVLAESFTSGAVAAAAEAGSHISPELAGQVVPLVEGALARLRALGREPGAEERARVWELAVLLASDENVPSQGGTGVWGRPRLWALRRHAVRAPDAWIALAVCAPGCRVPRPSRAPEEVSPATGPDGGTGQSRSGQRHRDWRQTITAAMCLPVLQVLALSVGMLLRPFGTPFTSDAARTGARLGTEAAGRAADLYLPLMCLALVVALVGPRRTRSAVFTAAAVTVLLSLPVLPLPSLWNPAALDTALALIGGGWGSWVQWGGLLLGTGTWSLITTIALTRSQTRGGRRPAPFPASTARNRPLNRRGWEPTKGGHRVREVPHHADQVPVVQGQPRTVSPG